MDSGDSSFSKVDDRRQLNPLSNKRPSLKLPGNDPLPKRSVPNVAKPPTKLLPNLIAQNNSKGAPLPAALQTPTPSSPTPPQHPTKHVPALLKKWAGETLPAAGLNRPSKPLLPPSGFVPRAVELDREIEAQSSPSKLGAMHSTLFQQSSVGPPPSEDGSGPVGGITDDELSRLIPAQYVGWYKKVLEVTQVRGMPVPQSFIYLCPVKPLGSEIFDPFRLVMVPHSEVDLSNFYTLSSAGVTHYFDGEADFMTAEEFLAEFHMFLKIRHMPVFQTFYLWRAFKGWKTYVIQKKQREAKEELEGRLFTSARFFQEGVLAVNTCCEVLRTQWTPFDLNPDHPLTLDDFIRRQEQVLGMALDDVDNFTQDVIGIAEQVCQAVLDSVGQDEESGADTSQLRAVLKDYLTSSMTEPLARAQSAAERLAQGRLQRLESHTSVREDALSMASAPLTTNQDPPPSRPMLTTAGSVHGLAAGLTSPLRSRMGDAPERVVYEESAPSTSSRRLVTAIDLRDTRSVYEKAMINKTLRRYPRQTLTQKIEETMAFHMRPDDWWKNSKDRKEKVAMLARFVRLVDVMVQETLRSIVEDRLQRFSSFLDRYQPTVDPVTPSRSLSRPRSGKGKKGVVFTSPSEGDEAATGRENNPSEAIERPSSTAQEAGRPLAMDEGMEGDNQPSSSTSARPLGEEPEMRVPGSKPFLIVDLHLLSNFDARTDVPEALTERQSLDRGNSAVFTKSPGRMRRSSAPIQRRNSNTSQDGQDGSTHAPTAHDDVWARLDYAPASIGLVTRVIVFFERLQETMTRAHRVASQRSFAMFFAQQARDAVHQRNLLTKRDGEAGSGGIGPSTGAGESISSALSSVGSSDDEGEGGHRRHHRGSIMELRHETTDDLHDFERPDYANVIPGSAIGGLLIELEQKVLGAMTGLESVKDHFVLQLALFTQNCHVTFHGLRDRYMNKELTLEGFEHLLDAFYGQIKEFSALPDHVDFRMVRVSLGPLKGALLPSPQRCVSIIHQLLPALAFERYNQVVGILHQYNRQLRSDLGSVEDFIQFTENLQHVAGSYEELLMEADSVRDMYRLLTVNEISVPAMQYAAYQTMANDFQMLKETIDFADQKKDKLTGTFEQEIHRESDDITHMVQALQAMAQNEMIFHIGYVSPDPLKAAEESEKRRKEEAFQKRMAAMQAAVAETQRAAVNKKSTKKKGKGKGKHAAHEAAKATDTVDSDVPPDVTDTIDLPLDDEEEVYPGSHGAPAEVVQLIDGLVEQLRELRGRADKVRRHQRTFDVEQSQFIELAMLTEEVELKRHMWKSIEDVDELVKAWLDVPVCDVSGEELNEKVSHLAKLVMRIERGLPPNKILPFLAERVHIWSDILPVVLNLRNPDLRPRHWLKIEEFLGRKVQGDKTFTVKVLLNLKTLPNMKDYLLSVSTEATQEAHLDALLKKIQDRWLKLELIVKPYKDVRDTYILGSCDHVIECLEDSQMTMMIVQSSKYAAGIRSDVEKADRSLHLFSDTLDAWLECQRQWLYLETIFNAQDIQRQMPQETKSFLVVDRQFREIMRKTKDRNNAMQAGITPGRLDIFQRCNVVMEKIIAKLEIYLESKRLAFPRFYLLSNDELIEILSQSRNPQAIQTHLQKCFEGIERLDFGQDPKSIDIFAMVSPEGESISLGKNLKARGSVEGWLGSVEQSMVATLRRLGKVAYQQYPISDGVRDLVEKCREYVRAKSLEAIHQHQAASQPRSGAPPAQKGNLGGVMGIMAMKRALGKARDTLSQHPPTKAQKAAAQAAKDALKACESLGEWVPQTPSQLAVLISMVVFTQAVEGALISLDPTGNLRAIFEDEQRRLADMVDYIRTDGIDPLLRRTFVAMVTMDVHNRDMTEEMVGHRTKAVEDFDWQMRLRAYYRDDLGDITLAQVMFKVPYGYEYLGAQTRLVQTPMTDRAYLTLTGALTLKLGGAPSGPAGTGKTETVKDLGKALGQPCVVFNCGDNIDHKFMGRFLSGIAQLGAWACFDEFNRIDIEVLSVVAQQLLTIQTALRTNATRFIFEGTDIPLITSCGVFITMNPGYAGRTELPDNLKALFRPMAMTTPDFALVAEVVLFSEGFQMAKVLSRKMVRLYKLSEEQLSKQDHYDWGMRALKSVLVMAGALNRAMHDVPEDLVLIKAIMDSNIPKLLSNDERLFRAIVSDLFPGLKLPKTGRGPLGRAVVSSCRALRLEPGDGFTEKVHHLFDTFGVRFGVMLVGPAGVGKTSIYRVLSHAMNYLHENPDLAASDSEEVEGGNEATRRVSVTSNDSAPSPRPSAGASRGLRRLGSMKASFKALQLDRGRSASKRSLGSHLADEDDGPELLDDAAPSLRTQPDKEPEGPELSPADGDRPLEEILEEEQEGVPDLLASKQAPIRVDSPSDHRRGSLVTPPGGDPAGVGTPRAGSAVGTPRAGSAVGTPRTGEPGTATRFMRSSLAVDESGTIKRSPLANASKPGQEDPPLESLDGEADQVERVPPEEPHGPTNPFLKVEPYVLNPKSVKSHELFGEFNITTDEWKDGLASGIIRAANLKKQVVIEGLNGGPPAAVMSHHTGAVRRTSTALPVHEASGSTVAPDIGQDDSEDALALETMRWIVFDGPVDSLWVENMNTVLDDNCMLCLPNGERIRLDAGCIRMLFEVHDLSAASPATISRTGMVYVPPDALGWRPLVRTWLKHRLPASMLIEADVRSQADALELGPQGTGGGAADGGAVPTCAPGSRSTARGVPPPLPGISFRAPPPGANARAGQMLAAVAEPAPPANSVAALLEKKPDPTALAAATTALPQGPFRVARSLHPRLSLHLEKLFDTYADPVLKYVRKACHESIPSTDASLVQATMSILQALIIRHRLDLNPDVEDPAGPEETWEEDEDPLTKHKRTLLRLFVFSLVWGVGGSLDSASWELFDEFLQDIFRGKVDFPGKGGVYDYFPDPKNECRMKRWDLAMPSYSVSADLLSTPLDRLLIPTIDTSRFGFLLENGLMMGRSVFISGVSGVGKSVSIGDTLRRMELAPGSVWHHQVYHLSGQTTCQAMQDTLETILVRKRKNKYGAPPGKRFVIFLDDVNLAEKDPYGVQSAIELLRQVIDSCGMYDKRNWSWTWVDDVTFVAACAPPGGGRHPLSSRFVRHFMKLQMPAPSAASLETIFGTVLRTFFDIYFTTKLRRALLDPIVHSSVDIYTEVCAHLLPTPAKSHYTFNLRDLTRVFQGLLMVRPTDCPDRDAWVRLWYHEIERAFSDRLVDAADRAWIRELTLSKIRLRFEGEDAKKPESLQKRLVLFGQFFKIGALEDEKVYKEGPPNLEDVVKILVTYQDMHNMDHANRASGELNLIFFRDTVEHISRIARALALPRGHVMAIGLGGSGKRTVAQFASFLAGFKLARIDLIRGYGRQEFREDLKKVFRVAGLEGRKVALLLTDSDIVQEVFLDDINSILTIGTLPGLFNREEREKIITDIRPHAIKGGFQDTYEGLLNFFQHRVEHNLRIVLTLSPAGDKFRERVRQFPALTNNCVIDWFGAWPRDALHSVAEKILHESFSKRTVFSFLDTTNLLSLKIPFALRDPGAEEAAAAGAHSGAAPPGRAPPMPVRDGRSASAYLVPSGKKHDVPLHKVLAPLCVEFHESVMAANDRFQAETRRHFYITAKTYIDTLRLYIELLESLLRSTAASRDRLMGGIDKLRQTNAQVESMREELRDLQPVLAERFEQTQLLIARIADEQREAEMIRQAVLSEENDAKELAVQAQSLRDEAQADLDEAVPALEAAVEALNALNKQDIVEIKSFTKPPFLVQLTMDGVCILLGEAPSWDNAKKVLNDPGFVRRLLDYDKDNIPDRVLKTVRRVTQDPLFTPNQVKQHSKAAMSMCMWVKAMETYAEILKVVVPKRQKLQEAEGAYEALATKLRMKQEELRRASDAVQLMRDNLANTEAELQALQDQAKLTEVRLQRAALLMSALGSESERWQESANQYGVKSKLLVGDAFLSAFFIGYLGPFTGAYRDSIGTEWSHRLRDFFVPATEQFNLLGIMSSPRQMLEWSIQGLPRDKVSQENAVMVARSDRYPLLIDPQSQASRWIRAMESPNGLIVIKATDPQLLRNLESAVRTGRPLLMEGIQSESATPLDPALDPLLEKRFQRQGGKTLVRIGATMTELDDGFRLYLCTRDPNPHFPPEICIKVTLVNFTVTREGLEEQLLAEVVRAERPDLETIKERLTLQISSDKSQLQELESTILRMLEEATGNILDNEELIMTLNTSRTTALQVENRLKETEETEREIEVSREIYRPAARRGSVLFFVISEMAQIEPMYQTSLAHFKDLFNRCIESSERSDDVYERLRNLMTHSTEHIFMSTCRGLYEEHRLVFAFLLAAQIQRADKRITDRDWDFLLRGAYSAAGVESQHHHAEYARLSPPSWLSKSAWEQICVLDRLGPGDRYRGLAKSICADSEGLWRKLLDDLDPLVAPMPQDWGFHQEPSSTLRGASKVMAASAVHASAAAESPSTMASVEASASGHVGATDGEPATPAQVQMQAEGSSHGPPYAGIDTLFVRLMLVKILREEEFVRSTQSYVSLIMGPGFSLDHTYKLGQVLSESRPGMPVLFLLAQGTDPTAQLQKFADKQGRTPGDGLSIISLGKGQGPIAAAAIKEASTSGGWVALLNCHLAMSWMPTLELILEDIQTRERVTKEIDAAAAALLPKGNPQIDEDHVLTTEDLTKMAEFEAQRAALLTPTKATTGTDAPGTQAIDGLLADEEDEARQKQKTVHPEFRIWMTSMPLPNFPTAVLQASLKIAMERPKGVRADILNVLKDMDAEAMELASAKNAGKGAAQQAAAAAGQSKAPAPAGLPAGISSSRIMSHRQLLMMSSQLGGRNASATEADDTPAAAFAANQKVAPMTGITWARLVFSLVAFHAIVLERRKFGALGWNVSYEFAFGDFESSLSMVRNLIALRDNGEADIQWTAIRYMVGDISYGGRVTDEHDRVLLKCILKRFLSEESVAANAQPRKGGVPLPDLSLFKAMAEELDKPMRARRPLVLGLLEEHARSLPENDTPEMFGLSRNADIAYRTDEAKRLVDTLLFVQPKSFGASPSSSGSDAGSSKKGGGAKAEKEASGGEGGDGEDAAPTGTDEIVVRMATEILQRLPAPSLLSLDLAQKDHPNFRPLPSGHDNSLGTVLEQEVQLFSRLLKAMRDSLQNLQRAVKGTVLMSKELEAMYTSILNNQVPLLWARVAYPSLKPLGSWVENLQERVTFLSKWITGGEPHTFWLSALFFPQGFLTALLQNFARRNQIAIDQLSFGFKVITAREAAAAASGVHTEGAIISGLYLEGAKLHPNTSCLAPCGPGEMVEALPLVRFVPLVDDRAESSAKDVGATGGPMPQLGPSSSALTVASPDVYRCPLYRTRARAGVAMTAGRSSNYVLDLALPVQEGTDPEAWTLQAVAAVCELDD